MQDFAQPIIRRQRIAHNSDRQKSKRGIEIEAMCRKTSKVGGSTYFPAANAEKEAHHIGLLLLLKFLDILEGTHFGYIPTLANEMSGDQHKDPQSNDSPVEEKRCNVLIEKEVRID